MTVDDMIELIRDVPGDLIMIVSIPGEGLVQAKELIADHIGFIHDSKKKERGKTSET